MTKNYFTEIAAYNVWANNIVWGWLDQISNEQWNQHIVSSFNSIAETALHVVSAETIWLDRLNKVEAPVWLQSTFKGSKEETIELWKRSTAGLKKFMDEFDEADMKDILVFRRINGDRYEMPHYHVFAHIFNHSTYHRGQLVTMLRQAGFTNVGPTDKLVFFRN